ncbi:MAG: hypothetical protein QME12_03545 [Nanoarchaeota archaeon]|nr:hypothetical protein [Nanoarchaeota archaeon]
MTLEDQLMDDVRAGRDIDVERASLIASGCDTEEKIAEYKAKLDELDRKFKTFNFFREHDKEWTAYSLNKFIWSKKGRKYAKGKFRLNDVIDALLTGENEIGNCLGLTCLYTVIGLRNGLELTIVSQPRHVYSCATIGNGFVDIENTWDEGHGKPLEPNGHEADAKALISTLFRSRGNELEDTNRNKADVYFRYAYLANPENAVGLVDFGVVLERAGNIISAWDKYTKAIEKDPTWAKPYARRAYINRQNTAPALQDINRAIALEPANAEHHVIKGDIYWNAGKFSAAKQQYERAVFLEPEKAGAYYGIGMMELFEGSLDSAIENLKQAIALDIKNFAKAYEPLADAYRRRANVCSLFGEHEQAKHDSEMAEIFRIEAEQIKTIKELKETYS